MKHGVLSKVEHLGNVQRDQGGAFHASFHFFKFLHDGEDLCARAVTGSASRERGAPMPSRARMAGERKGERERGNRTVLETLVCHLSLSQVDLVANEDHGDLSEARGGRSARRRV